MNNGMFRSYPNGWVRIRISKFRDDIP